MVVGPISFTIADVIKPSGLLKANLLPAAGVTGLFKVITLSLHETIYVPAGTEGPPVGDSIT